MTDATGPTNTPSEPADEEEVRERAADDLEPGGQGRTFADQGVREQVEREGDTHHPTGDGTGEV